MDAGIRHGSDTEDFITESSISGQSISICTSPPNPNSYRERHSGPSDAGTYMLQERRLELKKLKSFILGSKPVDLYPEGRETLFPLD